MTKQEQRRILRNYRNSPPSKFYTFNQKVRNGLRNNPKIPESIWAGNPSLISSYLSRSEKHDAVYHQAADGSKALILERDILQSQIVNYLDEIASVLEAVAVRNPDVLFASGFDLAKEGRGRTRTAAASTGSEDIKAPNAEQPSSE